MKLTAIIVALLSAVIAIALLLDAWRSARHDSQQLAATLTAQNAAIQQAADHEKQRDTQLTAALATLQDEKRTIRTPQQAAKQLPSVLPPLPLPVAIIEPNLSAPTPSGEPSSAGEPSPAMLSIPQPDLVPLYSGLEDCRANTLQIETLNKDLTDEKSRSASLQRERDAATAVAHGGSFAMRLKRAAKWFFIGVAAGAAATAIAHR